MHRGAAPAPALRGRVRDPRDPNVHGAAGRKQTVYMHIKPRPAMLQPELKFKLEKSKSYLLAQCTANPSIIVSGKSRAEIRAKIASCVSAYVQVSPKSRKQFYVGGKMKKAVFVEGH